MLNSDWCGCNAENPTKSQKERDEKTWKGDWTSKSEQHRNGATFRIKFSVAEGNLIDCIENGRKQEYISKSQAQEVSEATSGRCMPVCVCARVCVCVCVYGCMNLLQAERPFSEFLNTLFQFQKELQNKLPALRGAGALNYKVELPGNPKDPLYLRVDFKKMESDVNDIFWWSLVGWPWRTALLLHSYGYRGRRGRGIFSVMEKT